jgi:hypothetical protein
MASGAGLSHWSQWGSAARRSRNQTGSPQRPQRPRRQNTEQVFLRGLRALCGEFSLTPRSPRMSMCPVPIPIPLPRTSIKNSCQKNTNLRTCNAEARVLCVPVRLVARPRGFTFCHQCSCSWFHAKNRRGSQTAAAFVLPCFVRSPVGARKPGRRWITSLWAAILSTRKYTHLVHDCA